MSGKADRQFMQVSRYLLSVTHTKPYFSSLSIYKPQNTGYVCMKNSTGCAGINIGINGNPSSVIPNFKVYDRPEVTLGSFLAGNLIMRRESLYLLARNKHPEACFWGYL